MRSAAVDNRDALLCAGIWSRKNIEGIRNVAHPESLHVCRIYGISNLKLFSYRYLRWSADIDCCSLQQCCITALCQRWQNG